MVWSLASQFARDHRRYGGGADIGQMAGVGEVGDRFARFGRRESIIPLPAPRNVVAIFSDEIFSSAAIAGLHVRLRPLRLTGSRCIGMGVSHSPRDCAISASRMQSITASRRFGGAGFLDQSVTNPHRIFLTASALTLRPEITTTAGLRRAARSLPSDKRRPLPRPSARSDIDDSRASSARLPGSHLRRPARRDRPTAQARRTSSAPMPPSTPPAMVSTAGAW